MVWIRDEVAGRDELELVVRNGAGAGVGDDDGAIVNGSEDGSEDGNEDGNEE